ncbi:TadE/TadG family type IV pilus assembly protein [Lederbergia citri]|uniref:TadE/TadG family type IV pilus assembly protein n=1 Tax=Lederbergia citri TaxID=2833580 RepID=UPI002D80440E|nr:TadE family protein [Lederbergia citri]
MEFALVIPLFLLLLVGIIDFGRLLYSYTQLQLVTQETVRIGSLGGTDAEMVQYARQHAQLGNASQLSVSISPAESARKPGQYMTTTLSYPFDPILPLIDSIIPGSFMVKTSSTIRVE